MRKPAVFVSSTCYDLRQVRADLHTYLDNAGFEPVLSEYSTFPVDPAAATVANCRKAVESKADIFVLIIGCRYGSTDEHGKSITNLEYLTARAKGIPVYVFAMRSILEILPVWSANPGADFRNVVDSNGLFDFVSAIRSSGQTWVFPFDLAQDIVSVLRTQLAYLFADALELRKRVAGSGVLAGKYKDLSGPELRLVIDRPRAWEYLLFNEALLREIALSSDLKRDWSQNLAVGMKSMRPREFLNHVGEKLSQVSGTIRQLETLFCTALPKAFGPAGQPGDPEEIIYVANRVGAIYRLTLEWKIDLYRLILDDRLLKLRALVASILDNCVTEIEQFVSSLPKKVAEGLTASLGAPVSMEAILRLTIPDLTELTEEMSRMKSFDWD